MILAPIIDRTLKALTDNADNRTAVEDFIRPLYLKHDPANGAERAKEVLNNPAQKGNKEDLRSVLRDELQGHPESVHKLQTLVGEK